MSNIKDLPMIMVLVSYFSRYETRRTDARRVTTKFFEIDRLPNFLRLDTPLAIYRLPNVLRYGTPFGRLQGAAAPPIEHFVYK